MLSVLSATQTCTNGQMSSAANKRTTRSYKECPIQFWDCVLGLAIKFARMFPCQIISVVRHCPSSLTTWSRAFFKDAHSCHMTLWERVCPTELQRLCQSCASGKAWLNYCKLSPPLGFIFLKIFCCAGQHSIDLEQQAFEGSELQTIGYDSHQILCMLLPWWFLSSSHLGLMAGIKSQSSKYACGCNLPGTCM